MPKSYPEIATELTPDIDALTKMHEIQVLGLAEKHQLPVLQVAERCAQAIDLVFQKLEDATEIIIMHATTPCPEVPITIVDDIRYESPTTRPFYLMPSKISNYLTIDDLIIEEALHEENLIEEALDADTEPNGAGMDNRILATSDPEYAFEPDPETIPPPPNYIGPTPSPENQLSYSEFIALTKTATPPDHLSPTPSRVATPPFNNPTIFKQLINQTLRGPLFVKDPTVLTPTPKNEEPAHVDTALKNMLFENDSN